MDKTCESPHTEGPTMTDKIEVTQDKLTEAMLADGHVQSGDVEAVARALAPWLEGGREFDQMPKTRRELKIWNRNGMALINDATQDDALEAATVAIAAMTSAKDAKPYRAHSIDLIEAIAQWERENGSIVAITPNEYAGFVEALKTAAAVPVCSARAALAERKEAP